jgi:hypothetical protein
LEKTNTSNFRRTLNPARKNGQEKRLNYRRGTGKTYLKGTFLFNASLNKQPDGFPTAHS